MNKKKCFIVTMVFFSIMKLGTQHMKFGIKFRSPVKILISVFSNKNQSFSTIYYLVDIFFFKY